MVYGLFFPHLLTRKSAAIVAPAWWAEQVMQAGSEEMPFG